MNKNKIKLGFIGLGFVAQQCHLPTFSVNPNFKIEAISDPYEEPEEADITLNSDGTKHPLDLVGQIFKMIQDKGYLKS